MKKIVIFALFFAWLGCLAMLTSCSREKAAEQLTADPQMSQIIMKKLWETPKTKEQMVQMVMSDPESMKQIRDSLVVNPVKAAEILDMMLAREELKGMITDKTVDLHQQKK